ncbi:hypothetical protein [Halobacillus naozhouensis]|uniref:Uncharacterized protein n=1 Tax=Halobacillus naozhouensis TaxID=554880 RepID=A0ABY8J390_9BACI|nr:hypothetical protein [Halobacillus naozhouensis]WFT75401.1 hypothetical protein P9989_03105 [Halobacillus naozhouensis]
MPKMQKILYGAKARPLGCPWCGFKSKDAHLAALRDFQLLIGAEISNVEFREFGQNGICSKKNTIRKQSKLFRAH